MKLVHITPSPKNITDIPSKLSQSGLLGEFQQISLGLREALGRLFRQEHNVAVFWGRNMVGELREAEYHRMISQGDLDSIPRSLDVKIRSQRSPLGCRLENEAPVLD